MEQDFRWGGINVRYLLQYLLKRIWIGLALGAVLFLAGNILAKRSVSTSYSTSAVVYVIQTGTAPLPGNYTTRTALTGSANSVLSSDAFLMDVKKITGITDVSVYSEIIGSTNLLSITCTSNSPKSSYEFMRGIINNFKYITSYVSGDMAIQIFEAPKIPDHAVISAGTSPNPVILGAGGVFLTLFVLTCIYLVRITYKGTGEITRQFGEDILLIIPYVKAWARKNKDAENPESNTSQADTALCEIQKLSYIIRQEVQKNGKKVFFFTSAGKSEGKHTICEQIVRELIGLGLDIFYMDGSVMNILSHEPVTDDMIIHDLNLGCDTIRPAWEGASYSCDSVSSLLSKLRPEKDAVIVCGGSGEDVTMISEWLNRSDASYLIIREDTEDLRKIDALYKQLKELSPSFEGCILNAFISV